MPTPTPPAEVDIDLELVHALVSDQHPDLAGRPMKIVGNGWDNVTVRLGPDLCARLPRREIAAQLVVNEQRWLPTLAQLLPVPVPAPKRAGHPGRGYPWRWSIVPWIEGETAEVAPLRASEADALTDFLIALHKRAPNDGPRNEYRGIPLYRRAGDLQTRITSLSTRRDVFSETLEASTLEIWEAGLSADEDATPTWLHGDLHPRNVITSQGTLAGVVDWGDLCVGDRATDLACLWMLLPTATSRLQAQALLNDDAPISDATWARARAWAVFFALTILDAGTADDPAFVETGSKILAQLLDGP